MIGGWPKVVTFPVVTRKNEEDSRSTEQKSKEPSKTYIDHVFLEGGEIFQVPPTEVVASGGRWGSGGQDQQSCGHKMKLHSSVGQNSIQSRISSMRGWQAVEEVKANAICNVKSIDVGRRERSESSNLLALVLGPLQGKVIDRSAACGWTKILKY